MVAVHRFGCGRCFQILRAERPHQRQTSSRCPLVATCKIGATHAPNIDHFISLNGETRGDRLTHRFRHFWIDHNKCLTWRRSSALTQLSMVAARRTTVGRMIATIRSALFKPIGRRLGAVLVVLSLVPTAGVSVALSTRQNSSPPATADESYRAIRASLMRADLAGLASVAIDAFSKSIVAQTTIYQRLGIRMEKYFPSRADVLEFVRARSPTFEGVFLYALRVQVQLPADTNGRVGRAICQGVFTTVSSGITVICDPVSFDNGD